MAFRRLFFLFCCLYYLNSHAALVVSAGNGLWTSGTSWVGGNTPACGDSIVILSGHNITISQNLNLITACSNYEGIVIYGTLTFSNGKKLDLACNSRLYLFTGGLITVSGGGGSNSIDICNVNAWSSSSGNLSGPSCLPSTLPGCSKILPIELVKFSGASCGENICLRWTTASEKDNKSFTIEKTGEGQFFAFAAEIPSKARDGNSTAALDYEFVDTDAESGNNYYRLVQNDYGGQSKISPLIVVQHEALLIPDFSVYPNPGNGSFTLRGDDMHFYTLELINNLGMCTGRWAGHNAQTLEFTVTEPGVYTCRINGASHSSVIKLVVQ